MTELHGFEDQLRQALRRVEPPAGMEQRILRGADRMRRSGWTSRLRVAAAILVLITAGLVGVRWRQERIRTQEAEAARQQFLLAIEITSRTLTRAEQRLKAIGVERIELKEVFP